MATLTRWTLPLNPQSPYPFYLQWLTPRRKEFVYYTKYILNVVGELDVTSAQDNVREWQVPPALQWTPGVTFPGASGIVLGKPRETTVWFAHESKDLLISLDTRRDVFMAYGGGRGRPIRSPRHLMFDNAGRLWHTGTGEFGARIGYLDLKPPSVTFWELPIQFLTPEGLHVEPKAQAVWFSPLNLTPLPGAFLARLDPHTNQIDYWTLPGQQPRCTGVAGEPANDPENVWFTHNSARVYRLEVPRGRVFEYDPGQAATPRRVAIDREGNAWISDWAGRVSRIDRGADCGTVKFDHHTVSVNPATVKVRVKEDVAKPQTGTASVSQQPVNEQPLNCYRNFPVGLAAQGIHCGDAKTQPETWFCQASGIQIGRLTP